MGTAGTARAVRPAAQHQSANPARPAGGCLGRKTAGKGVAFLLPHILKAFNVFSMKGGPFASIVQRWLMFSLNFSHPLIYAMVASRGKCCWFPQAAIKTFQPHPRPLFCVLSPTLSPGRRHQAVALRLGHHSCSSPCGLPAASKAIWQMGCEMSIVPITYSHIKKKKKKKPC